MTAGELELELHELIAGKNTLEENKKLHERCEELYEGLVQADELRKKADEGLLNAKSEVEKVQNEIILL